MQHAWLILRSAWSAVVIAYLVLFLVGSKRLRGEAKRRNGYIFAVIAFLIAIRELIFWFFARSLAYRLAVLSVGIAAGIAALIVAMMLITQESGDEIMQEGSGGKE